jgi:hypothetical protein
MASEWMGSLWYSREQAFVGSTTNLFCRVEFWLQPGQVVERCFRNEFRKEPAYAGDICHIQPRNLPGNRAMTSRRLPEYFVHRPAPMEEVLVREADTDSV